MRSAGKIYVVVGVLVIIFLLIIGYLIYLDRKIHKLENQSPNGEI
jgi:CcmD family protein